MVRDLMCLPVEAWPRADVEAWGQALDPADLFEPTNVASTWRSTTIATVEEGYGYALAWLARTGLLDANTPPSARWTSAVLRAYIAHLKGERKLRPATVHNRVLNLERALAAMSPRVERVHLRRAVRRLAPRPDGSRKRHRLRNVTDLVALGRQLMADAEAGIVSGQRKNAALFRDGLQIALLALRPLRRGNFASLRIGTHLRQTRGEWWILIDAHETKTSAPIEVPFPGQLVPDLGRYLEHYRPCLAGGRYTGDRLWVSYRFGPQHPHSIQLAIAGHTTRAFGTSINPHLFRDCVATSIAIHDPENVRMAATILGHRSFSTTERHYILSRQREASRIHGDLISARRKAILTSSKRGGR